MKGVPGVGPKRAASLVVNCGDWQAVADRCTRGVIPGVGSAVIHAIAYAAESGELKDMFDMVKLRKDVPLPVRGGFVAGSEGRCGVKFGRNVLRRKGGVKGGRVSQSVLTVRARMKTWIPCCRLCSLLAAD